MTPTLSTLPTELLTSTIAPLSKPPSCIPTLRLVSRRFNAVASLHLITSTSVSFTSSSIRDLEDLSNHVVFSKGVREVHVDVTYFDKLFVEGERARSNFMTNAISALYSRLECIERSAPLWKFEQEEGNNAANDEQEVGERVQEHHGAEPSIDEIGTSSLVNEVSPEEEYKNIQKSNKEWLKNDFQKSWESWSEWSAVITPGFDFHMATEKQKVLLRAFEEYAKLFEDQENVSKDGEGVKRIVQALERFPALKKIIIKDNRRSIMDKGPWSYARTMSDKGLKEMCLRPSIWKGTFVTDRITSPPVHHITDLFTALAKTQIRPTHFKIILTAPADTRSMHFSFEQLGAVRATLARAEKLTFHIIDLAPRGSSMDRRERSREEMVGLGALTKTYFSSALLKKLNLDLGDYPGFYTLPRSSIDDFILLPLPSPHLRHVKLSHIPINISEIRQFVDSVQATLTKLHIHGLYLLGGTWKEGLEVFRNLGRLQDFEMKYSMGGEFGAGLVRNDPKQDIFDYVMGRRETNPMYDWVSA